MLSFAQSGVSVAFPHRRRLLSFLSSVEVVKDSIIKSHGELTRHILKRRSRATSWAKSVEM